MAEVIEAYRSVSVSDELKEIERLRELARHNEASAIDHAARKRAIEIAVKMKAKGKDVNEIAEFTELTVEEIRGL